MPVLVSLEKLVGIKDSRPAWPAEFEAFAQAIEADPNAKDPWGVAADWLDDVAKEPDLAEAFRWIHKRDKVEIEAATESYNAGQWRFVDKSLPPAVRDCVMGYYIDKATAAIDNHTLPGLAAKLAAGLRSLKSEMF